MRTGAALAICLLAGLALPPPAGAFVYWTNYSTPGAVGRAADDGSGANPNFLPAGATPCGVAVDGAHIYWANSGNGAGSTIGRADLDGNPASVTQSFITGANAPCGVAVDGAHIYWANESGSTIGRADLDGNPASVKQDFIPGVSQPCGVAVNGSHIYWGNAGTNTIGRANLDGGGVLSNFITGADDPCGVAVDAAHIYWANYQVPGSIGRANLDGNPASVNQSFVTGTHGPCGVAVDASHIYWGNADTGGGIGRIDVDGNPASENADIIAGDGVCGVAVAEPPLPPPAPGPSLGSPPLGAVAAVLHLSLSPAAFRAAGGGGSIARTGTGTKVSYADPQVAITTFTVLKPVRGVRRGRKCVSPRRLARRSKPCTRYRSVGSFSHSDAAGTNSFHFTGRVRGRKLRPGPYRLRAVPHVGSRTGPARTKGFRIVR